MKNVLYKKLEDRFKNQIEVNKTNKARLAELNNQIEKLEERFVLGEITKEQWNKFSEKTIAQKEILSREIEENSKISSDLETFVNKGLKIAENLHQTWVSSNFENKVRLQKLVFPEGITYCEENDLVLTFRVNSIFAEIPVNTGVSTKKQNENSHENDHSASSGGIAGCEHNGLPALKRDAYRCGKKMKIDRIDLRKLIKYLQ